MAREKQMSLPVLTVPECPGCREPLTYGTPARDDEIEWLLLHFEHRFGCAWVARRGESS